MMPRSSRSCLRVSLSILTYSPPGAAKMNGGHLLEELVREGLVGDDGDLEPGVDDALLQLAGAGGLSDEDRGSRRGRPT
jgi:hypothetical protein